MFLKKIEIENFRSFFLNFSVSLFIINHKILKERKKHKFSLVFRRNEKKNMLKLTQLA
jgi:hypothetical protein